jgi:hypothetical protein
MIRTPVQSSNVRSVGWEAGVLEVEFKGGVYRYVGVPREIFDALLASNSKGQFINEHVKGVFDFEKVAA